MSETQETAETPQPMAIPKVTQADRNRVIKIHRVMFSQLQMIDLLAEEYRGVSFLLSWLKSTFDKDAKFPVPEGTTDLDLKKIHHDNYATVAHMLSTRIRVKHKDMEPIYEAIAFAREMANTIRAEIELVEPPVVEEQKPFEMDLTHVKPKEETVQ